MTNREQYKKLHSVEKGKYKKEMVNYRKYDKKRWEDWLNTKSLEEMGGMSSFYRFIAGSFTWSETIEGYDYWLNIANKYQ